MRLRILPLLAALVLLVVVAGVAPASAARRPFGTHDCAPRDDVRFCPGTVATRVDTFDGVPLDADVALRRPTPTYRSS